VRRPLSADEIPPPEFNSMSAAVITPAATLGQSQSGRALAAQRLLGRLTLSRAVQRYQPQIDLQSGRIAGAEALLCVPGPRGPELATAVGIDVDAAGLSIALFEHQVRTACRAQVEWLRVLPHEFPLAVPVSARVFNSGLLLPIVLHSLEQTGLPAAMLELEIDEAQCIAGPNALRILTGLRAAGLCLALSGANAARLNLRMLALMPVTKLRMDALALLRAGDDLTERRVFDGIVGAARGLDLAVCTTGVNSAPLFAAVVRQIRSLTQGDEVGAALDAGEFLQRLRDLNETTATLPCLDAAAVAAAGDAELTQPGLIPARRIDLRQQTGIRARH
jgi:EAL domain-containing protein (putative c-di-GMP-specific phosphodiesterase class I)